MVKTSPDGFMARHFSGIQEPDFPTYEDFLHRIESVDDGEKEAFLEKIKQFWVKLGKDSVDGESIKK